MKNILLTCGLFITIIFAACDKPENLETVVRTYAGSGTTWNTTPTDGGAPLASFNAPTQLAVHPYSGLLYVVDGNRFVRTVSASGVVSTLEKKPVYFSDQQAWATYSIFDVYMTQGQMLGVTCAEFESDKNQSCIALLDPYNPTTGLDYNGQQTQNHLWSLIRNQMSDSFAGTKGGVLVRFLYDEPMDTLAGSEYGYADGTGTSALFGTIYDMVQDDEGNLYIADGDNHCIRKVSTLGEVTTYAGTNEAGFNDGIGSGARLSNPRALAIDKNGILYVADTGNHAIRRINLEGGVSTIAGGIAGFENGPVESARFNSPEGIALDDIGRIFVADRGNNVVRVIARENISTD